MPKIQYVQKRFTNKSLVLIEQGSKIIEEYKADGLSLTLRQLYYQFVSRDLCANTDNEYRRIGNVVSDARLAGLIDWNIIEDRTRNLKGLYYNIDPGEAINDTLRQFKLDHWDNQNYRPEVWIEKEALTGVIARICNELDVPFFACKGYTSQSEMWRAGRRMMSHRENGQIPVVIHLGDHDPSGIDMTRDIVDRLRMFNEEPLQVERIALNFDQIKKYDPPPNPAKMSDARAPNYVQKYGKSSWELDALNPRVIRELIEDSVTQFRDQDYYDEMLEKENGYKAILRNVANNWESL